MLNKKVAFLATSALVGAMMVSTSAFAQSTGSQLNEVDAVIVTGSAAPASVNGAVVAETAPKSKATITQEFIGKQTSGQTILQTLNLTPGLNFTNNDPYGSSGGNIRLRGFDGNRISVTFDGIPMNDTGNYATYSNQQLDGELIERASVNLGTTDVDSPTASAVGGTINYITLKPSKDFGGQISGSLGEDNYRRVFGLIQTGELGPWGTRAWFAASYQKYDKWKGPGDLEKKQFNARIYQDIGDNGDFISLAAHYNENRNNNYRALTLADFNTFGPNYDYESTCVPTGGIAGNCANYYGRQVNPSNTGNIRGQSSFHLADNLRLTVDPSFQYTLADGGSQLGTISETDGRVKGTGTVGKDLNGNGVIGDTVAFFTPSVTNTRRYGLSSSLIWDINDDNRLRVAYTLDYGRHRQTGDYGTLDTNGSPTNVFGGKDGEGQKVLAADGSSLRARDRFSIATLNQIALEYRGRFVDNKLLLNVGLRAPFFKRELNQYCYSQNGSTNVRCTTEAISATLANGNVLFAGTGTTQYIAPYAIEKKFDKVLPNLGASFEFVPNNFVYGSYAEGISVPRTDNLYTITRAADGSLQNPSVQPETTKSFDLGYRYQGGKIIGSAALWYTDFQNRIVSSYDDVLGVYIDRNVGKVKAYGFDGQIGWQIWDNFSAVASVSYNHSELQENLRLNLAGDLLATKGKRVVETPEWTVGGRIDWKIIDSINLGVQAKYVGDRFSTDVNDQTAPSYTTVDVDLRFDLPAFGDDKAYLQFNITNLTDETYFGSISSRSNSIGVPGSSASAPTYYIGAPRTVQATLTYQF